MDRHQLDARDAERLQVVDDGRRREARVRPAHVRRDLGVADGEALDVQLVDRRARSRDRAAARTRSPTPPAASTTTDFGTACALSRSSKERSASGWPQRVSEDALVPPHVAVDRARVGIDEQLVGVEAMAALRLVGAVHAVAVALPGPQAGNVDVPDLVGLLGQHDPARLDVSLARPRRGTARPPVGVLGEEREVHALAVPRRAEGIGAARPDFHEVRPPATARIIPVDTISLAPYPEIGASQSS